MPAQFEFRVLLAGFGALLVAHVPQPAHAAALPAADNPVAVEDFFHAHCYECHGNGEAQGGLSIDALGTAFDDRAVARRWARIHDRLSRGEMPPKESSRPPEAAAHAALDWIAGRLAEADARRHAAEGRAAWRRLNRTEYQNTIRDLLFVDVDLKSMLPDDGLAAGFDNVDAALDVTSIHMEKYLEAADVALASALAVGPKPETRTARHSFLDDKREVGRSLGGQILALPDAAVFVNETYPPKILRAFSAPVAGQYKFRISAYAYQSEKSVPIMIYAGSQDTRRGKTELTQVFDAPPGEPAEHEWTELLDRGDTIRIVTQGPNKAWGDSLTAYKGPGLAVRWIEVTGPLVGDWPPPRVARLLGTVDSTRGTLADAEHILRRFMPRAFRRPIQSDEVEPYLALVQGKLDAGGTFDEALRVGLKAVLVSPDFLYLATSPGPLDDHALASRLSYFLWSTMPDEALLQAAADGRLGDPAALRAQVERMLDDPRAQAFVDNFTGHWLKLRDIKATMPDRQLYPEFDPLLEWSMVRESREFFAESLRHDLSVLNDVDSPFAMLNSRLAEHYGIPGVDGLAFRKVPLEPEWRRGGVLGQAAVLKVTANGTNTSPVVRGTFVLDRILGLPPSPPPKNVPAIEPDIRGATTIRAQLAQHRDVEMCATCHNRIDPPGAALECYDVIGGLRERYRAVTDWNHRALSPGGSKLPYGFTLPCETDGTLDDGRTFAGVEDFKRLLLDDPATRDQIVRAQIEKLLIYATGHELDFADRESVARILEATRKKDFGRRSLIHEIVQSETFRKK